jgi:hypothetical protein
MKTYSVKETADKLNTNTRKVQRLCKRDKVRKKSNQYLITDELINGWIKETTQSNDNKRQQTTQSNDTQQTNLIIQSLEIEIENLKAENTKLKEIIKKPLDLKTAIDVVTLEAIKQGVTHKIFTNDEFEDFIGTIALSEYQEEQIKYLRDRIVKQDEALISIAKQVEQRNYIEARDKGYDKPK